jgi:hypothetical protein
VAEAVVMAEYIPEGDRLHSDFGFSMMIVRAVNMLEQAHQRHYLGFDATTMRG